uniref:CHK kinase-like domain-containing protein n=1 Tax=Photinus pyralis TaxID=7054 RepID=A0A1Y1KQT4_PHOPY
MALTKKLLSEELLEEILTKFFQETIRVLDINISSDVSKHTEHFCSLMKRVKAHYLGKDGERRVLSMVAKCFPEDEYQAKFVGDMKFFDCELAVYGDVIPRISRLEYQERFAPKVYFYTSKPSPMLLLEDLASVNYKIVHRRGGLDLKHSRLVMEKLAFFHAASYALLEKGATHLTKFVRPIYRHSGITYDFVSLSYDEVVKVCENVAGLSKYVEKLRLSKEGVLEKIFQINNANSDFKVLTHGDCWINNLMFHYDHDNEVDDVRFVDFQNACFTTPCLDLHHFLASSLNLDTRTEWDVIVDHYFKNLMQRLKLFGTKTLPTREQFDADFRLFSYCGLGSSLLILPLVKSSRTDGTVQSFFEDYSFRHHCFNNEDYLKEIEYYLPFYDSLGIFDLQ